MSLSVWFSSTPSLSCGILRGRCCCGPAAAQRALRAQRRSCCDGDGGVKPARRGSSDDDRRELCSMRNMRGVLRGARMCAARAGSGAAKRYN